MKHIILSFFLFAGMSAFAQLDIEQQGTPEIEFEKTDHLFGAIPVGSDAVAEFKFTNTGNAPLIITNVDPSCGCTVPTYPKQPIKPGESGVIKAKYTKTDKIGAFSKSVKVLTNEPVGNETILWIKGSVESTSVPVEPAG